MIFPQINIHFIRYDNGTPANTIQPPKERKIVKLLTKISTLSRKKVMDYKTLITNYIDWGKKTVTSVNIR